MHINAHKKVSTPKSHGDSTTALAYRPLIKPNAPATKRSVWIDARIQIKQQNHVQARVRSKQFIACNCVLNFLFLGLVFRFLLHCWFWVWWWFIVRGKWRSPGDGRRENVAPKVPVGLRSSMLWWKLLHNCIVY